MSGYRDDTLAAQARIAELEAEVAALRSQLAQSPATQGRIAELHQRREDAVFALAATRRAAKKLVTIAAAVVGVASLMFVAAIASLGESGHPMNAAVLSLCVGLPIVFSVWYLQTPKVYEHERAIADLDRQIHALLVPGAEQVRVADPPVRVATEAPVEDDLESEPDAKQRRARG